MRIERTNNAVSIAAPAKLNLFLEVLRKRADGFHDIESVMCPVSVFDHLYIERTRGRTIELRVQLPEQPGVADAGPVSQDTREAAWDVPVDSGNLVFRAAEKVREALGGDLGCRIHLQKRIWAAAGLGGGSSDAAAAIVGCMLLWGSWNRPLATELAAELGSDVPFFLGDTQRIGLGLAQGRGEQLTFLPAQPQLSLVIMHPPSGCSTKDVYARWRASAGAPTTRSAGEIIAACETGQTSKIGAQLFNALQSPAATLCPWVEKQLTLLRDSGYQYVLMTGSGSSCFAIIESASTSIADPISSLSQAAREIGISRICSATTFFAPSVEEQLANPYGMEPDREILS